MPDIFKSRDGVVRQNKDLGNGAFAEVVSASVAAPVGGATEAKQDVGNASLATIASNTTGVATAANQATGNASLSTIASNTAGIATAVNQVVANASLSTISQTASGSQSNVPSQIIVPQTTYLISSAGTGAANSVTARVQPGGVYSFAVALPATAAAAVTLASSTTTVGNAVVSYTGASPSVGALLAGTGIAPGAYVTAVNAGVSYTMSIPASASGTVSVVATGGAFTVQFESSPDNVTWSPLTVIPKTVVGASAGITSTNTIGLFFVEISNSISWLRARLSSLTTITQVAMFIDAIVPNKAIRLPFISGVAANVPVNMPVIPPIECSDIGEIAVDFSVVTGATMTFRQANDPLLASSQTLSSLLISTAPSTSATTAAAAGLYRLAPRAIYAFAQNTTVGTTFSIAGVTGRVGGVCAQDSIAIGSLPTLAAVTTVTTVSTLTGGSAAEDAAAGTNPVLCGGVVRTATAPTTLVAGDAARLTFSSAAQAITKPYSVADTDWQYTGTLTTTTAQVMRAAGAAGIRNYVTGIQFQNTGATASTVLIQDGATTIAQFNAPANMASVADMIFLTPLRGTAATAMNVNCGTAGASILMNAQGYQSA